MSKVEEVVQNRSEFLRNLITEKKGEVEFDDAMKALKSSGMEPVTPGLFMSLRRNYSRKHDQPSPTAMVNHHPQPPVDETRTVVLQVERQSSKTSERAALERMEDELDNLVLMARQLRQNDLADMLRQARRKVGSEILERDEG